MKNFIIKVTIVVVADTSRDSMMVDLPLVVDLEVVHVGRHQDVADLKFVGTVGTGGPVKFFLAV